MPATKKPKAALLLTPGASAGRDQPSLVAIDERLRGDGIVVERMDFPYRLAGRRAPDRAPVLVAAVRRGAADLRAATGMRANRIFLGGRSMGGRMCSMAVAEGEPAAGLVLISYPLHPPGKPEALRTQHFPAIRVPCLFVSGTRDSFATKDELQEAASLIDAPVTHVWVEGGDHGLRRKDEQVANVVAAWLPTVMG